MARPTKERTWLPGDQLRIKAFARMLKAHVLPDASREHEDAMLTAAALQSEGVLPNISPGRWSAWWKGEEMPSAANVQSIRAYAPKAAEVLDVNIHTDALRRHFFALDLMGLSTVFWDAAGPNAVQLGLADSLINAICKRWLPEIRVSSNNGDGCLWIPAYDAEPLHHSKLFGHVQYVNVLEPASVIVWLLTLPELLSEKAKESLLDELALDIYSCALAIDFRLSVMEPGLATCSMGLSGTVARFVRELWLDEENQYPFTSL